MLLQIEERQIEPGITVLDMAGRLALGRESQRIEALVDDLLKKSVRKVIFEMSKVDYIDSAGTGQLALSTGKLKEAGGELVVVVAPGRVLDMLRLTQITSIVTVVGTMAEAEAALQ